MIWNDRTQAGKELSAKLTEYSGQKDAIILGLPRGGVVVAYEVAKSLKLPLDIVITRKIGAPDNPELAIAAIDETGEGVYNEPLVQYTDATNEYLMAKIEEEKEEIRRRKELYRKNKPPLDLRHKVAIIVDDGIATGYTVSAAARFCRSEGASKIVIAVPVVAFDSLSILKDLAEDVIYLDAPENFGSVGQFYERFGQVTDEEVIKFLNR